MFFFLMIGLFCDASITFISSNSMMALTNTENLSSLPVKLKIRKVAWNPVQGYLVVSMGEHTDTHHAVNG